MNYRHRFQVRAPLACVSDFHNKASSIPAITPPPLRVRLHQSPDVLGEGDDMDFSLGVGPISIRWERVSNASQPPVLPTARYMARSPNGFTGTVSTRWTTRPPKWWMKLPCGSAPIPCGGCWAWECGPDCPYYSLFEQARQGEC